jgi:hypothetical protein
MTSFALYTCGRIIDEAESSLSDSQRSFRLQKYGKSMKEESGSVAIMAIVSWIIVYVFELD